MRKKIYGIATALALAMGCGLFLTYPVQAAETQDVQQEESDYFTLPNGKKFLAIRKLKRKGLDNKYIKIWSFLYFLEK